MKMGVTFFRVTNIYKSIYYTHIYTYFHCFHFLPISENMSQVSTQEKKKESD